MGHSPISQGEAAASGEGGRRQRALVFYPYQLKPGSGAKAVAAWIVHALQLDQEVTLVCAGADLEAVNRRYGTDLDPRRVRIEVPRARLLRWMPLRLSWRLDDFRQWSAQRVARRMAPRFDLVVCAGNEADLGDRGIQYVNDPSPVFRRRGGRDWGWYHATSLLGIVGLELSARLAGFSYGRMRRNLTLVPSRWVGEWVHRVHGIDSVVLHPPAAGSFPLVPWGERVDGFVWCGRYDPCKRIELVIDIVDRVRRHGLPATLTLVATHDDARFHAAYRERICELVRQRAAWVTLREHVDRSELCRLMASHRYGLHASEEDFGIAVAELVRAGSIVFVPREGGQAEVVGADDRLLYLTQDEAADKIVRTMRDPRLQDSLRAALSPMGERFGSDRFVREFRRIVALPHGTGIPKRGEVVRLLVVRLLGQKRI